MEILKFMRSRGIAPIIITNGTLLTRELAVATNEAECLCEITLHSYRREVHDEMVGRRGAWQAAMEGITNLQGSGGRTLAVFVATKLNYMAQAAEGPETHDMHAPPNPTGDSLPSVLAPHR